MYGLLIYFPLRLENALHIFPLLLCSINALSKGVCECFVNSELRQDKYNDMAEAATVLYSREGGTQL